MFSEYIAALRAAALEKIKESYQLFLNVDRDKLIQHVCEYILNHADNQAAWITIVRIVLDEFARYESHRNGCSFSVVEGDKATVSIMHNGKIYHYSAADIFRDATPLPEPDIELATQAIAQGGASS